MPRPINPAYDDLICRRYIGGDFIRQIAEDIGMSETFVRNRLKANCVQMRPRGGITPQIEPKEVERTIFLYERMGLTCEDVGQILGVSRSAIHARLRRAGVELRPRGKRGNTLDSFTSPQRV